MKPKKTTLMLDEAAYDDMRRLAAERGESVSLIVCEALREYASNRDHHKGRKITLTKATPGTWIGPVDPRGNAELFDLIEDDSQFLK